MPKKKDIEKLFNNIAPNYDRLNHIMSFGIDKMWRKRAVRALVDGDASLDILDVATGTGDFAIEMARRAPAGSRIVGIDLSEQMLSVGEKKAGKTIRFVQGDCEALPFPDASFDRVSVAFGIRNFEHLEQGLSEMCRVLRPGGKIVMLELSYPDNSFLKACFKMYALGILPRIGRRISGDAAAYRYLPNSILHFPKSDVILPMMKTAGFIKPRVIKLTFGICLLYIGEK